MISKVPGHFLDLVTLLCLNSYWVKTTIPERTRPPDGACSISSRSRRSPPSSQSPTGCGSHSRPPSCLSASSFRCSASSPRSSAFRACSRSSGISHSLGTHLQECEVWQISLLEGDSAILFRGFSTEFNLQVQQQGLSCYHWLLFRYQRIACWLFLNTLLSWFRIATWSGCPASIFLPPIASSLSRREAAFW